MTSAIVRVGRAALLATAASLVLAAGAGPTHAQAPGAPAPGVQEPAGKGRARRLTQEQQLQRRLAALVRRQLGLTDAQALELARVSEGYVRERRELVRREQVLRRGLRTEMERGAQADQERVATAIDGMLELERARLAVVEREQRDLAGFLTPVQRAKYLVLQQQVRRRLEEARGERAAGRPGRYAPLPR